MLFLYFDWFLNVYFLDDLFGLSALSDDPFCFSRFFFGLNLEFSQRFFSFFEFVELKKENFLLLSFLVNHLFFF